MFDNLSPEQKDDAIVQMLSIRRMLSYPFACIWIELADIYYAINDMGYSPDIHFSFQIVDGRLLVTQKYSEGN